MSKSNGKRAFGHRKAVRERVPLLVGLGGASSSGKTYSALRLAAGIQSVTGGPTFVIDTEARRSLHYADRFDFEFVQFDAPFSPDDYRAAIEYAIAEGARQIVIDSMSHEHEGPGGVLEWHSAELERMGGGEKNNFRAWSKPKQARRDLINFMLQQPVNFLLCFRAKEKIKPPKKGERDMQELGWSIIGAEELAFEMTARFLLHPNSGGVPTLASAYSGEQAAIKTPEQFSALIHGYSNKPIDEALGAKMAEWAAGDAEYTFPKGEHAGKKLRDVPVEYLSSLIAHDATPEKLARMCEAEVERRIARESGEPDGAQAELGV